MFTLMFQSLSETFVRSSLFNSSSSSCHGMRAAIHWATHSTDFLPHCITTVARSRRRIVNKLLLTKVSDRDWNVKETLLGCVSCNYYINISQGVWNCNLESCNFAYTGTLVNSDNKLKTCSLWHTLLHFSHQLVRCCVTSIGLVYLSLKWYVIASIVLCCPIIDWLMIRYIWGVVRPLWPLSRPLMCVLCRCKCFCSRRLLSTFAHGI